MSPSRKALRHPLLALLLAGACLLATPARAGQAEDHFTKGNTAFEAEKYDDALAEYEAAWKLTRSYDVAMMLGITELRLGKAREAAEHLAYAQKNYPLAGDEEQRKNLEANLTEAKKEIGVVRLKSTTKDVTIKVDGAAIETSAIGTDLFLAKGNHVFEATAPGHRSTRRTLDVKGGEDEDITMNLTADQVSARGPLPAIVLGGVGVVGIVIGAALVGTAEGKKSEALKLHDEIGSPEGCAAQPDKCQSLRSATSTADALGNGGVAAFVFGGLAAAAAGAYLLLPSRKPASTTTAPTKVSIVPAAGPNAAAVMVLGNF